MIPYGRQHVTDDDVAAVTAVLRSDWLTQGPAIERFEADLCRQAGAGHAVAVNSATSALHVACAALGLGPGDRLWTSPNTFLASAYAGLYCGAAVDFVDIEPATGNMSATALADALAAAELAGRLPKVVVPVHFAGRSCDMEPIHALARRYGFAVVEDAAHAIGGRYRGDPVGSGRYADVTVFSFHPVKVITTTEGGAALTGDAKLAARMRRLRSHGTTRDPAEMDGPPDGPWTYQALELGWNYRMTDLQAALGSSQLQRLEGYVARRAALAARYTRRLAGTGLTLPPVDPEIDSAWHLYVIGWDAERAGIGRRAAFEHLRAAGIGVQVHYAPVHLQPLFRAQGFRPGQFPNAEAYYARAITLPLHATLTEEEQDRVIESLPLSPEQRRSVAA
ncbi:UDP-4-amino-4,6-dideoxy-N-acetyl-beta-L-altrosamine transaminase [Methylobacterium sp. J-026]|uniref:UDP-4-amino-4, 6-dideoxy-N-acetyl-beta-L-altrosamine transaminase n=1 Tax=Methylobacterium sp. J-026 TaxID=2836624 RepID=UPI001FBACFB3|nr:UDP-4-amino-4,6-dideoxy-N-acetyl-beta-L-altrosamine transaminase [Methylobacterium sp. J-026]MCJ2136350.1 UDP-4-amino-4,6-dideoxy-N-acetyl-beta-L-altrosamine transaminase [Methylobacterium sp. J-026]